MLVVASSGCGVRFDDANGEDRGRLDRLLADPVWDIAPPGMTVAESDAGAPTGELTTGTGKGDRQANSAFIRYVLPAQVAPSETLTLFHVYVLETGWEPPTGGCSSSGAVAFSTQTDADGYVVSLSVTYRPEDRSLLVRMVAPHHSKDKLRPDGAVEPTQGVDCLIENGYLDDQ